MKKLLRNLACACVASLMTIVGTEKLNASVITSISGGIVHDQPSYGFGEGPVIFGVDNNVTYTSTDSHTVFGYSGGYGLQGNGEWTSDIGYFAGVNDSTSTLKFEFANPVSDVGGFLNYAPHTYGPATIAAYDESNNLIESTELTFLLGYVYNGGQFLGFHENSNIIKSFTVTGGLAVITDLTTNPTAVPELSSFSAAVPEPSTFALASLGGLGLVFCAYRRRRAAIA